MYPLIIGEGSHPYEAPQHIDVDKLIIDSAPFCADWAVSPAVLNGVLPPYLGIVNCHGISHF